MCKKKKSLCKSVRYCITKFENYYGSPSVRLSILDGSSFPISKYRFVMWRYGYINVDTSIIKSGYRSTVYSEFKPKCYELTV